MIRDLEAEGVLPAPAKSYGSAEFSTLSAIIGVQGDIKRLNEVVAGLAAKVRALEAEIRPTLQIKGEWQTTGDAQP